MPEIYVSTDVEADGPIPGPFSMLSFGSAAFRLDGEMVSTFSANLLTLPDATPDSDTAEWWRGQPEAWAACRLDAKEPETEMPRYVRWLKELPGRAVFVGFPAAYDFMFVYWYLMRFAGESPFSFSALDIKTLAMVAMGGDYRKAIKRNMPREWFGPPRPPHVALEDAIAQCELFLNIMRALATADRQPADRE